MPAIELAYWAERIKDHPLPDSWLQTGQICAMLGNCHRGKNQRAFKADDFIPKVKKAQTWEEQHKMMKEFFKQSKGT